MTRQDRKVRTAVPQGAEQITLHLEVGASSETGPSRELNEDCVDYYLPSNPDQMRAKGALFVVADGMGGYLAGEVASKEAVGRVTEEYYADTSPDPGVGLIRAISAANRRVLARASTEASKSGMGTTLVAAVIRGTRVYVANVGDSRAYQINRDTFTQITHDHSWVQEQLDAGMLTPEQAQKHPQRNLITRALGRRQSVKTDLFEGELVAGDAILLCTDGVHGPLSGDQIARTIRSLPPSRAAVQLVTQAGAKGGTDNASALVIRLAPVAPPALEKTQPVPEQESREPGSRPSAPPSRQRLRPWMLGGAGASLVLCLLAAVVLIPALMQKLTGNPMAAPLPAPLEDDRMAGRTIDQVALYLGYADSSQMIAGHGGLPDPAALGSRQLWPATRGVLLVGVAREWSCERHGCSFRIDMAGTEYLVTYDEPSEEDIDLEGHPTRVYGTQQEGQATVAAQLIERGSLWWAWWQPAWTLVVQSGSWDQSVWVYTIVDKSPNGLIDVDQVPGLQQGTQLLLRGMWHVDTQPLTFQEDQIYTLRGARYVPLTGQPAPPVPTVTLQPTSAVLLDTDCSRQSASSVE